MPAPLPAHVQMALDQLEQLKPCEERDLLASLADPDAPPASALRAWRIYRGQTFEVPLTIG